MESPQYNKWLVVTRLADGDWAVSCFHEGVGGASGRAQAVKLFEMCQQEDNPGIVEAYFAENISDQLKGRVSAGGDPAPPSMSRPFHDLVLAPQMYLRGWYCEHEEREGRVVITDARTVTGTPIPLSAIADIIRILQQRFKEVT